jgi:hypothetical protein
VGLTINAVDDDASVVTGELRPCPRLGDDCSPQLKFILGTVFFNENGNGREPPRGRDFDDRLSDEGACEWTGGLSDLRSCMVTGATAANGVSGLFAIEED